jgi:hypothetical protein
MGHMAKRGYNGELMWGPENAVSLTFIFFI